MAIVEADAQPQTPFEQDVAAMQRYFDSPRFEGIIRLYSARQVVEQRGTIPTDYTVARQAAAAFYDRLRELFETFAGPKWHSARWDHSVDLRDKRVGLIGTGSTAIQIVCGTS